MSYRGLTEICSLSARGYDPRKITLGLNLTLFVVLAVCSGMALWGLGSMAWSKKKQNFGGVNEGQSMLVLALAGAAGTTVIRGVFAWLGV